MKNYFLVLLFTAGVSFSQGKPKVETYNHGHNGMELIAKSKKGTVIISTFNSKMTIREEVAQKVYNMYIANQLESNKKCLIKSYTANVFGNCIIRKRKNLTVVDFYYEKIEWLNGLVEVYMNKR